MHRLLAHCAAAGALATAAAALFVPAFAQGQTPTAPIAPTTPAAQKPATPYTSTRWESEIAKFEEADKKKMPEPGGIVFVGSSSIKRWKTLKEDFAGMNVLNRGFGGSRLEDSAYFADRVVLPYKPKTVVLYAGDNDLSAGVTPLALQGNFRKFATIIHNALPETRVIFLAVKPSLSRWKIHEKGEEANRRIKEWSADKPWITYVDTYTPMLGTDGKPRPELYVQDGLHMTPAGYTIWTGILRPILQNGTAASATPKTN